MSGGIRQPTVNHALTYLKVVEITLKDEKEKFQELLHILTNVYYERNNPWEVRERVKELLKDHIGLLFGFNVFLPDGYEIKLPLEDGEQQASLNQPMEIEEAVNFLRRIRMTHFEGGVEVYYSFLDILKMYRRGSKSIAEVYWEVFLLFQGHIEVINEFNKFLPTNVQDPVMLLAELSGWR